MLHDRDPVAAGKPRSMLNLYGRDWMLLAGRAGGLDARRRTHEAGLQVPRRAYRFGVHLVAAEGPFA